MDILKIKRDKQADLESYDNYLKNDHLLKNEKYMLYSRLELDMFRIFFTDYLLGNTKQVNFYIKQLNNITINYRIFKEATLDIDKFINLISFQIALIIENMNYNKIDISMFEEALKLNSIIPFINKCKENLKVKTAKALATEMSIINSTMKEKYQKGNVILEEIHSDTFEKELSKWKNNKEYPTFLNMLVIINSIETGHNESKIGHFFQLLITRALLYIQKEYKIDEKIKNKFSKQLQKFRFNIAKCYSEHNEKKIFKLQNIYLIDFPNFLELDKPDLVSILKSLKTSVDEFIKHNSEENSTTINIPNKKYLIDLFNQCKTKEDYKNLLNKVHYKDEYSLSIKAAINLMSFIISIKIGDKNLFNEKFKYLDRSFGSLLSIGGIEKNLKEYTEILNNKSDFIECRNIVTEHFKKLSTLE